MKRRTYVSNLAALLAVGGAGCLDSANPGDESAPLGNDSESEPRNETTNRTENVTRLDDLEGPGKLVIDGVYPKQVERGYIDYEYVDLWNAGGEPLDVSGYVVDYGNGRTYEFGDLMLDSGASIALMSRSGDDARLDSDPPVYLRFAGFGESKNTSVLDDDRGRVVVRNAEGEVVAEREYGTSSGNSSNSTAH